MSYLVIWTRPGDSEKQYQVFGDRRTAEAAALSRRNQGADAHVVDTSLESPDLSSGLVGSNLGGFRA